MGHTRPHAGCLGAREGVQGVPRGAGWTQPHRLTSRSRLPHEAGGPGPIHVCVWGEEEKGDPKLMSFPGGAEE